MSARATEHMSEPSAAEINADQTNSEAAGESGVKNDAVEQGDAGADIGAGPAGPDDDADVVDPDPAAESQFEVEADLSELSVETLVADLERVAIERDQYLETSRRIQAEFENYRKQVSKRELEARERANVSQETIIQSEEELRLARERFRVGAGTTLDVIVAQANLANSRAQEVQAMCDFLIAETMLYRAVGRTNAWAEAEGP